jgi:DNA-binding FadR family transcriptional regulator
MDAAHRVHLPRLADVVAAQIRDAILEGELVDGERLPPLDHLLDRFGVSAPSMREALRVLEAEGLLVVQRGGIGGAIVRRPTPKTAAYTMALVLRSEGSTKHDVATAVTLLQPVCVELCARRPDRATAVVPTLVELNDRAEAELDGDPVLFNDAMVEFHREIVRLAGNDTMSLVTRALEHIWLADLRSKVKARAAQGQYPDSAARRAELDLHRSITVLIAAGDAETAAASMRDHLERSVDQGVFDADEPVDPTTVRFSRATD